MCLNGKPESLVHHYSHDLQKMFLAGLFLLNGLQVSFPKLKDVLSPCQKLCWHRYEVNNNSVYTICRIWLSIKLIILCDWICKNAASYLIFSMIKLIKCMAICVWRTVIHAQTSSGGTPLLYRSNLGLIQITILGSLGEQSQQY